MKIFAKDLKTIYTDPDEKAARGHRKDITEKWENKYPNAMNRQRSVFPSSQALFRALYLVSFEATKKWTMPIWNWGKVRGE